MNLNQITVPSQDIDKSIAFYQKLGLELIVHSEGRYARFVCPIGDSTFSIHHVEELPGGEGIYVYFEVEDVVEKISEIKEIGLSVDDTPEDKRWLWTEARIKDPDGNQIIIYHAGDNRKNPPWRIN